jgi:predicted histone-like DNA-binding protein
MKYFGDGWRYTGSLKWLQQSMLFYNLIQRGDPRNLELPKKWYATPASRGRITIDELSKDIAGSSSLSQGDIANVLKSLLQCVPKYLLLGMSVDMGDMGSMRISFSSEGFEQKDAFNASSIGGVKIIYTPSTKLKHALLDSKFKSAQES